MKAVIVCVTCLTLLLLSCSKINVEDNIPECIKNNIEANKNSAGWGIKSVDEYQYQGMTVYVYTPDITYADATTEVIKPDCTTLCSLGGFSGNRMCNGDKFFDKAVFMRTIWKK